MDFRIRAHQDGHLVRKRTDRQSTEKLWLHETTPLSLPSAVIYVEIERTYCFTTVGEEACGLLEGFLQVVFEALVLVLLRAQLHEFTWKHIRRS